MIENNKIKFLITVDVETCFINRKLLPFETNVYGRINGKDYGVPKIIEICNNYNVKANFFVDVYEHYKFEKNGLKELCQKIRDCGHSVQLHAHPNFIPDCTNGLMKSYDLETQSRIINEGKQLIEDWTGEKPIAFRAGAYGANIDTITALERNGFLIDCSYFSNHKNCDLPNKYQNRLFMINQILEIPTTVYDLSGFLFWKKRSKIDLNACSFSELKNVTKKLIEAKNRKLEVIVLFLHSFSFIRWNNAHSKFYINYKIINKFNSLLDLLVKNHSDKIEFMRIDDFDRAFYESAKQGDLPDYVPQISILNLIPRLLRR